MWRAVLMVALAVGLAATASEAAAQTGGGTLTIGSGAAAVGETAYVNVLASDVPAPGVAAYAVSVQFDPTVLQVTSCSVDPSTTCEQPDDNTIEIRETSKENATGNWVVAGVTFRCAVRGLSPLTLARSLWASASVPETKQPAPGLENGSIQCGSGRISATLSVQAGTGVVGGIATVNIVASHMLEPGLGAWTVDMTFDPSRLSPTSVNQRGCTGYFGTVCSMHYSATQARFTGASASGLLGDITLGTAFFRCLGPGTTAVSLTTNVFADANPNSPQNIDVDINNGTVTCLEPATTVPPVATPTPPSSLPPSGGGNGRQPITPWWPVALLAAGGAMAFGAVWMRRRR